MRNENVKKQILEKIKSYDRIVISRHIRPDGDAVGSTMGLLKILKLTYPEKEILLAVGDHSEYLSFMGEETATVSEDFLKEALMIVVDTATVDRISGPKPEMAKEVIKIDHHIETSPYGDLSWVEDDRSSACEMIADFYISFQDELKIDPEAATFIYTGMVTDSGRFRFESVTGETLRHASVLLDQGIDTEMLFANLYLNDFDNVKSRARLTSKIKTTENGVAYLYISRSMQKHEGLTIEQASAMVSLMESIRGSLIWLAFIECPDKSIRVRLRSRFATVNGIAEHYHGGGHSRASGATVYSKKEMKKLICEADAVLADYKKTNGDAK